MLRRYAKINGIIIKNLGDKFWVKMDKTVEVLSSRGNLKKGKILVGDKVEVDMSERVISKVLSRKNELVRPPVANIDNLFIVIASVPKPDFFVVDKLILFAFSKSINPVIVINKDDIRDEELNNYVISTYQNVCQIFCVSASIGYNIKELANCMSGCINAMAGQSAVGKSSLLKAINPNFTSKVGELSKKIARGKNTTRHCEIFELDDNSFIIDTPGFSLLDEAYLPFKYDQLASYYPDFTELASGCRFANSCMHINESEKDCAIKRAVKAGDLSSSRYERYCQIYKVLESRWKNEYK